MVSYAKCTGSFEKAGRKKQKSTIRRFDGSTGGEIRCVLLGSASCSESDW